MQRSLPIAALLALSASGFVAHAAPHQAGFDCAKASTGLEQAICADPDTAAADRAMMVAYNEIVARQGQAAFNAAIQAEQRAFLAIRREAWDIARNREMALTLLRDETERRAEWLNWITPAKSDRLTGTWSNAWGVLKITQAEGGRLTLDANVADQVAGTWLCGFAGDLAAEGPTEAVGYTVAGDLVLRRSGPVLEVPVDFCDETGPPINGSMKGVYFKIGAED